MSDWLQLILGIITSYLLGSIPTSVWIGKWFYNTDIRKKGSGNAGATNTIRVLGFYAGIPVLLFDVFKAWIPVYAVVNLLDWNSFNSELVYIQIAFGLAAVLGHVYPIYIGFKGGKGVATLAGMAIGLFPIAFLFSLFTFILVVIFTRYVSLGSILAAIVFPLYLIFFANQASIPLIVVGVFASLFIIYTHRGNMKKLLNGTENKFGAKKT